MNIFSFITLFGGLAFFLYGMHVMSSGLEKMAGGKLEKILKKMTSSPWKSFALGAGITIAIQSSSAMTVMLVGLVNSGIMQLSQTIGVIMGSNVGTTLTAWILSMAGIESENFLLQLLQPKNFSPIFALIGITMIMVSKKTRRRDIGQILVGFSILMFGMELMSGAVKPLADMPQFQKMLTAFNNPLLGVLVGTVFTGIIQSSAASVGILQALSLTGGISYGMAIPIIMGQNIGTCVTSLISSIGVNKNAKRVAAVHISFNMIGTIICLTVYYLLNLIFDFSFNDMAVNPVGIAFCHSVFNVITTLMLFPFQRMLVKIAEFVVRDKPGKEVYSFIDERLLNTPSFAIAECTNMTVKMARLSRDTLIGAIKLFKDYNPKDAAVIIKNEEKIDAFEDKLGTYLVRLSSNDLSDADTKEISKLLHTIGDFERIGDHAVNLLKTATEIHDKEITFSDEAQRELGVLSLAVTDILKLTIQAFEKSNLELASKVEPLEQVIDGLTAEIKNRHIERLKNGGCTIQMGFVLSDMLTNYERVSDHCSNIAVTLIEVAQNSFDTHEYLEMVKSADNASFKKSFGEYELKYQL